MAHITHCMAHFTHCMAHFVVWQRGTHYCFRHNLLNLPCLRIINGGWMCNVNVSLTSLGTREIKCLTQKRVQVSHSQEISSVSLTSLALPVTKQISHSYPLNASVSLICLFMPMEAGDCNDRLQQTATKDCNTCNGGLQHTASQDYNTLHRKTTTQCIARLQHTAIKDCNTLQRKTATHCIEKLQRSATHTKQSQIIF